MANSIKHKLQITGPEEYDQQFIVPLGITSIGRQAGNDLHLDNSQISRSHAQLVATNTECEISDQGSSNGTYVNDEKITPKVPYLLTTGDIIRIGPFTMGYSLEEVEEFEEAPAPVKPPKKVAKEDQTIDKEEAISRETPQKEPKPPVAEKNKTPQKPPDPPKPPTVVPEEEAPIPGDGPIPVGLTTHSQWLLSYLPGIYHNDFMARFLGLFELILVPIKWNIDHFDHFLDPGTSPAGFLPWLANWFEITFDPTWTEDQKRALLNEAHALYARRGTRWALQRVLEIYTGHSPEIVDTDPDLDAYTFEVSFPVRKKRLNQEMLEIIIDANKPAHTSYKLRFRR